MSDKNQSKEASNGDHLTWAQVSNISFKIVFAILGFMAIYIFNSMNSTIKRVESNVSQLNQNMAVSNSQRGTIITKMQDHENRIRVIEKKITQHSTRVKYLENKSK